MNTIHVGGNPAPDPQVPCCMAAWHSDGGDCTCWTPVRDLTRQVPKEGPSEVRRHSCEDCAYLNGSPERAERDGDQLDFGIRDPFFCHQGMPFVVLLVHPDGSTVQGEKGDYDPIRVADRVFQADGTPGILCAGWAAANQLPRGPR